MPMTDTERKTARQRAIRARDADRLEAALGPLPGPVAKAGLVVLIGLPGGGKSHFARALAGRYPAAVLDSDALRGVLFADPRHTQAEHARLFPAIHVLMERLLTRGVPVIVDATNLKEANRRPYYEIGTRSGARTILVRVWAPPAVARARLRQRPSQTDPRDRSSADLAVYEAMRKDVEPIRRRYVSVNTALDIGPSLDKVLDLLQS
jgi:predicted kinase